MAEEERKHSTGGLHMHDIDTEGALGEAEDWEDWETKLVGYSIGIGVVALIIFGIIINLTILA
jgi:hypothetical protein